MTKIKKYMPWAIICILAFTLFAVIAHGQSGNIQNNAGPVFDSIIPNAWRTANEKSFIEEQHLPNLSRMSTEDTNQYINSLQVMKKIEALGLDEQSFLYPESSLDQIYTQLFVPERGTKQDVIFTGTTSEELNDFLQDHAGETVFVQQKRLQINESVFVPSNTSLIGDQTELHGSGDIRVFYIENQNNIEISGFTVADEFAYGIYIINSNRILVADNTFENISCKPVVIMGTCSQITIQNNTIRENGQGGIYLNGDIAESLIEGNIVVNNGGTSNWMAGIVLTAIDVENPANPYALFRTDLHFPKEQRLDEMLTAPHRIIIRNNAVSGNNSSGIYCDGAYLVYISDNRIIGNDKEGMCLDYGTLGAYVARNDISGNGNRARQTDQDLENDFVLAAGRLEDGSSRSKLPGISIDNSAYNIIYNNRIEGNYGSGVKMVRTGVRNIISTNVIHGNNLGRSDTFHFFGIELGYAAADVEADNLDFVPDYENIICRNIVSGEHYAGIFLAEEVYINDFFDNVILDSTDWSMESLSQKYNNTINNLSQIPSRGISLSVGGGSVIILPGMSD